jgi:SIT4-associating protein SAP185/190
MCWLKSRLRIIGTFKQLSKLINSLVTYLSKEDHIKSLLHWVVSGLDELDEQAHKSDLASFAHAVASVPSYAQQFKPGPGSPPLEPAKVDEAPYSPDLPAGLGQGLDTNEGDDDTKRARYVTHSTTVCANDRYPQVATEILTSDLWSIPECIMSHKDRLLRPFWEADEFWSDEDEERHRQRETIRGFWTRINASLLLKRPQEVRAYVDFTAD